MLSIHLKVISQVSKKGIFTIIIIIIIIIIIMMMMMMIMMMMMMMMMMMRIFVDGWFITSTQQDISGKIFKTYFTSLTV